MIGVIADDLTGAAEIGAVGLRHGLRAEVVLAGEPSGDADLVCLDTDSRSCAPGEAAERAARAARLLRQQRADWVYKKTDSVLRGNVTPELEAIVTELGLDGALLVPANPSLGRTIVGGQYFVRGQLIHETEFARDPKHPRSSSDVRELVATPASLPLFVRRAEEGLPERGIVIGEAASPGRPAQMGRAPERSLADGRWRRVFRRAAQASGFTARSQSIRQATNSSFAAVRAKSPGTSWRARREQGVPVFSLPQELAAGGSFDASRLSRARGPSRSRIPSSTARHSPRRPAAGERRRHRRNAGSASGPCGGASHCCAPKSVMSLPKAAQPPWRSRGRWVGIGCR